MQHSEPISTDSILGVPRGAARDLAAWRVCETVGELIEHYRPMPFPGMSSALRDVDAERLERDDSLRQLFCEWRAAVTYREDQNAGRLTVLVSCLRDLTDLRARAADDLAAARVDELAEPLQHVLAGAWRVDMPSAQGNLRAWSIRVCRRYDLLPREMREL